MVTDQLWTGWLGRRLPSNSIIPASSLHRGASENLVGTTDWFGRVVSEHSGHSGVVCAMDDMPCPAHKPSKHHMRFWPVEYTHGRDWYTRTCPHGESHPDPDSFPYWDFRAHAYCDGCCGAGRRVLRYVKPLRAPDVAP